MLHVTRPEGTLLYTGDFKLRPGLTAEAAEPIPADVLVTESTFGRPFFRFPPRQKMAAELVERVGDAAQGRAAAGRDGLQPRQGAGDRPAADRCRLAGDLPRRGPRDEPDPRAIRRRRWASTAATGSRTSTAPKPWTWPSAACWSPRRTPPAPASSPASTTPCSFVLTGWAMLKDSPLPLRRRPRPAPQRPRRLRRTAGTGRPRPPRSASSPTTATRSSPKPSAPEASMPRRPAGRAVDAVRGLRTRPDRRNDSPRRRGARGEDMQGGLA